jgi:hypothetical protein
MVRRNGQTDARYLTKTGAPITYTYTTHTLLALARESTAHSRIQAFCTQWRHASMVPYKTLLYPRLGRASTQVPDVCIWMQYVLCARAPILLWDGSARDHGPSIDLNVWMGSKKLEEKTSESPIMVLPCRRTCRDSSAKRGTKGASQLLQSN